MTRRGIEARPGPLLCVRGRGSEGKESGGEEFDGAKLVCRHGEESSTKLRQRTISRGRFLPIGDKDGALFILCL